MTYDRPDKGSGFSPSDHPEWENQLLIIWPQSVENVTFTRNDGTPDPTDMVTADVAIITLQDPQTGRPVFLKQARIGGKALTPMIKNKVGKSVIGKLVKLPKQPGKNAAFALEFPPESPAGEAEWQQWVAMAQQYEQQYPRTTYEPPAAQNEGQASWQNQTPPAPATPQAAPAYSAAPSPAPGAHPVAPSPNGATPTGTSWGATASPTGTPHTAPANTWNTPPSPPPAAAPPSPPWPEGLADFLKSRGYDVAQIPDEATARQIAATLQ